MMNFDWQSCLLTKGVNRIDIAIMMKAEQFDFFGFSFGFLVGRIKKIKLSPLRVDMCLSEGGRGMKMKNQNQILSVLFFALVSCNMNKQESYLLDVQGHRGARAVYPENSIPGFIYALELGLTTLEMDAVITKDSQVVLSHEPWMGHEIALTPEKREISESEEKNYNIYKMTYAEVHRFDCGSKLHPRFPEQLKMEVYKPLLSEVIDTIEKLIAEKNLPKVIYNIETKSEPQGDNIFHPTPDVFSELLMQVIQQKGIAERVTIQSFDVRTLQYIHQHFPEIKLVFLIGEVTQPEAAISHLGFVPFAYSPNFKLVNQELKTFCTEKNMQLIPWTVNDEAEVKRLLDLKVDGIISDNPKMIIDMIGKENVAHYNQIKK
jgi:glycerophosphoryl diester phosphodiesterase